MLRWIDGGNVRHDPLVDKPVGVMMPSRSATAVRPDARQILRQDVFEMFLMTSFSKGEVHRKAGGAHGSIARRLIHAGRWEEVVFIFALATRSLRARPPA